MKKFFKWCLRVFALILFILLIAAQCIYKFRTSDEDAKKMFDTSGVAFRTVYLPVGDRIMHYVIAGSNDTLPTLVFIHGSPGSWDAFERYLLDTALLARYRMVSIDRPGFGYSNFGDALHFNEQGILLSAVLQKINNGKPMALVGHSLGGPMVIKLAAENPTLPIANIVVLAGSVDPIQEEPEQWRGIIDKIPLRYFIPGSMRPSNDELKWFKKDVYGLDTDFARVTCNAILMHGDSDQLVPPPNALYSQAHLTHAKSVQLTWFKGENHFIPWHQFDAIKQQLLQLKDMQAVK